MISLLLALVIRTDSAPLIVFGWVADAVIQFYLLLH